MTVVEQPQARTRVTSWRAPWVAPVVVAALSLLASGLHAALGPGFVLDDWFTLRNAAFDGTWAAAGTAQQAARPGAAAVYAFIFGVIGPHPLVALAVLAVLSAATASLLVVLLRSWFPEAIAVGAAVIWVVLPNHLSLEVWASAANISVSVLLVVLAGIAMVRSGRVRWLAVPLLMASALCYEAVIPVAAALAVAGPWAARGRVDRRLVLGCAGGLGAVALWIVSHWHPDKHVASATADLTQAFAAHLGWGIAPSGPVASLLLVIGLLGIAVALVRVVLPSFRSGVGPGEVAVVVGVAVAVLGTVPFARYLYAPLGAGDRFNFVSAVGGALVWAGIAWMTWAWRRALTVVILVALFGAGLTARVQRSIIWHRAAHDAVAIRDEALRAIPAPDGPIAIGPVPIQEQNVAAYLDHSNIAAALQLAYDDPSVDAVITFSSEEFEGYAPSRRVDIGPLSTLRPDTEVTPG